MLSRASGALAHRAQSCAEASNAALSGSGNGCAHLAQKGGSSLRTPAEHAGHSHAPPVPHAAHRGGNTRSSRLPYARRVTLCETNRPPRKSPHCPAAPPTFPLPPPLNGEGQLVDVAGRVALLAGLLLDGCRPATGSGRAGLLDTLTESSTRGPGPTVHASAPFSLARTPARIVA